MKISLIFYKVNWWKPILLFSGAILTLLNPFWLQLWTALAIPRQRDCWNVSLGMLEWPPASPDLSGRSVMLLVGSIPSQSWSSLGFVFKLFSFVPPPCALIPGKGWKLHCKPQGRFAIHINNFNWIHFVTLRFSLPYFMGVFLFGFGVFLLLLFWFGLVWFFIILFFLYQVFLSWISIKTIISIKRG